MQTASRSILIAGATGGIGSALSRRLAEAGHSLVLTARTGASLESLREQLLGSRDAHHVIPVDMGDDASVSAFAETLRNRQLRLDGVVLMPPQPHATADFFASPDAWRDLFQASFIGPLSLLKAAIEQMKPDPSQGRRCKVVIVSGISSVQVLGHYATSNVLRCAWVGQAKTLAFALGERGIHVLTLSLGGTLSPWYKDGLERRAARANVSYEERLAEETSNIPLRKYGTPEEVAVAIEGLLSSFSDHMTGVNILCDGGFTRAY